MRRISSHEPRYKHSTQGRKIRHADSREQSESSSSEEEDESTDSEESESSSENETPQGGSFPSVADLSRRVAIKKTSKAETFMHTSIDGTKIIMLDKVTQKNLLSPFPSFTLPPVYKEIVRPGFQRAPEVRSFEESDRKHSGKPPKSHSKRKETRADYDESSGSIHKHSDRSHRKSRDRGHHSKECESQQILSCMSGCEMKDASRRLLKSPPESEIPSKRADPVESPRKRKTVQGDTFKSVENRDEQRKAIRSAGSYVNASAVRDSQKHTKVECCEGGSGEVKEKLVYVVEEKGKERRKIETDLFTLNEILTIKKDLLELSEFAKKLKRMKEMVRDPENGKNQQNYCHCKPATDLLRDVNRRIEALEARQEELEKDTKPGCKGDVELQLKNDVDVKTLSECPSVTAEMPKQSALPATSSIHRMEMILPKADGFSNNSEIVNELMDIKTQLQKLERRRMSKEVTESVDCTDSTIMKQPKLDDRGIAVFSSKTYILAENLKKIDEVKVKAEAEKEASKVTEGNSKGDRTKGDVEKWLRNVSPGHLENVTVCDMTKGRGHTQKEGQTADLKRKDCSTVSKNENFEKEQPKNRATRKGGKEADLGVIDLAENVTSGGRCSKHLQYKECIVTPSGKIFARITKSKTQPLQEFPMRSQTKPQRPQSKKCKSPEVIRPTGSCSSIPSITHGKEGRKRLHDHPRVMKSKSVHDLSGGSSVCKFEKTDRNTTLKNFNKAEQTKVRGKRHKEDKSELVKRTFYNIPAKPSRISSSHSEFLASMNLEAAPDSPVLDSSGFLLNSEKKGIILSYPATHEGQDLQERSPCCSLYLHGESAKKRCREEKKEMKKRESELKKILKKQIKEYKRQKLKLKKEKRNREKDIINDLKCQKYKCHQTCKYNYASKKQALLKENDSTCPVKEEPIQVRREVKGIQCQRGDSETQNSTVTEELADCRNDSLEIYKKSMKKGMDCDDRRTIKPTDACEDNRPVRQTCCRRIKRGSERRWLQNFLKNLDVVYPRFCALNSPNNYPHEHKIKFPETYSWRALCGKQSSRFKKCDQNYESSGTTVSDSVNVQRKNHSCYDLYSNNNQQSRPQNFPCRCMKVYMQPHMKYGWSGLRAPIKSSTDTSSDLVRSRSAPICGSNKSGFDIPGPKSQVCLAACKSKEKCKKKRKKKHKGEKKRKKSRKCKQKCKIHCTDILCSCKKCKQKCKIHCTDIMCNCQKCGNVHRREEDCNSEEKSKKCKKKMPTCNFSGRNGGDIFPMFSFLSSFCKTKPKNKKCSLKKIAEVRHLKTCSTSRKRHSEECSEECSEEHNKGKHKCKETCCETPSSSECRKKKKKKKKKKKCARRCSDEKHSKERCDSDCSCSKKKKKHKRKHKKKCCDDRKKKKKKKECVCCSSQFSCCPGKHSGTLAYYQTAYPSKFKSDETTSHTESSESSSSEENQCCFEPKFPKLQTGQQNNRQIKDRLSSFHSFWKTITKIRPSKPQPTEEPVKKSKLESSDSSFINDGGRSSEIPCGTEVVELEAEPSSFASICKKRQKLTKEEKNSRKESKKEGHAPKSKSAKRRHL